MEDIIKLQGIFENGYGFIAKKVMKDKNLNVISKAIYSYICSYSGKGQDAFPSQSLICFDLGISKGTLSKYMKELKENGYIKVRQENSKGKFSRNIYTINIVPCIISPYTVKTDTQITVHGQIDTNNNSSNNNNNYNNNNKDNQGGNEITSKKSTKANTAKQEIIEFINNLEVSNKLKESLLAFEEYRRIDKKKPWTVRSLNITLKKLKDKSKYINEKHLILSIENSIENTWQGIIPARIDKYSNNKSTDINLTDVV